MYFDEEIVLDARLNCLNPHVDYFIIIESCFTHRGDRRELNFDINKYKKFKDKIIYKVYDKIPNEIDKVFKDDDETTKSIKYIMNALYRENGQRNFIIEGIKEALAARGLANISAEVEERSLNSSKLPSSTIISKHLLSR